MMVTQGLSIKWFHSSLFYQVLSETVYKTKYIPVSILLVCIVKTCNFKLA